MQFGASSSPLSNGESCGSLSCFYQKLFKTHSITVTYDREIGFIEILLL
jgi:hypothetical protein